MFDNHLIVINPLIILHSLYLYSLTFTPTYGVY
nr:MAG TPA: hypothetical protein [Caudoviricetes sp.]